MKPHRAGLLLASGSALALLLAACGGSSPKPSPQPTGSSQVFTYDTAFPVIVNGWDPATEDSDGIIAMSNIYETLTRYNPTTHTLQPAARDQLVEIGRRADPGRSTSARGYISTPGG
jgi:ABC-type transport system substrate-binding protein